MTVDDTVAGQMTRDGSVERDPRNKKMKKNYQKYQNKKMRFFQK
jgi:hypothetical protein